MLTYSSSEQRIKTETYQGATLTQTKYYSGLYEKEVNGSVTRELHYIFAGGQQVAIMIRTGTTDKMYYTCTDHLGSVTALADQAGAVAIENGVKQEFSFDAWGRRRNPTNWTYTGVPTGYIISRGFTGHEHHDQFGIINMNGRIYDPVVGRFLSPDKYVQGTSNTQSYNRYSYCLNNPLSFTDPSGWVRSSSAPVKYPKGDSPGKGGRILSSYKVYYDQDMGWFYMNPSYQRVRGYANARPLGHNTSNGSKANTSNRNNSANIIVETINNLYQSPLGGTWSPNDGVKYFTSPEEVAAYVGADLISKTYIYPVKGKGGALTGGRVTTNVTNIQYSLFSLGGKTFGAFSFSNYDFSSLYPKEVSMEISSESSNGWFSWCAKPDHPANPTAADMTSYVSLGIITAPVAVEAVITLAPAAYEAAVILGPAYYAGAQYTAAQVINFAIEAPLISSFGAGMIDGVYSKIYDTPSFMPNLFTNKPNYNPFYDAGSNFVGTLFFIIDKSK